MKIERRYARLVGLRLESVGREPGSATWWENHEYHGTTAFVVELPGGRLSAARGRTFARAVFQLVAPAR